MSAHNSELDQSIKALSLCKIEPCIAFDSKEQAKRLEKYFETGAGKAVLYNRILMFGRALNNKNEKFFAKGNGIAEVLTKVMVR